MASLDESKLIEKFKKNEKNEGRLCLTGTIATRYGGFSAGHCFTLDTCHPLLISQLQFYFKKYKENVIIGDIKKLMNTDTGEIKFDPSVIDHANQTLVEIKKKKREKREKVEKKEEDFKNLTDKFDSEKHKLSLNLKKQGEIIKDLQKELTKKSKENDKLVKQNEIIKDLQKSLSEKTAENENLVKTAKESKLKKKDNKTK